jgi:hypothetical protein
MIAPPSSLSLPLVTNHLVFPESLSPTERRENGGLKAALPPSTPHSPILAADEMVWQKELNGYSLFSGRR